MKTKLVTEKLFKKLKKINWGTLVMELLIVFIGVYGAFQLDSYRSSREELKNKIIYFKSFELILDRYFLASRSLKEDIDSLLQDIENNPDMEIKYLHEYDFTNSIFIIESVFSSDRFSGIDSEFMMNLETGANQIKALEERIKSLRDRIYTSRIYGKPQSKEFKEWYLGELKFISKRLSRLIASIEHGALPETQKIIKNLKLM